MSIGTIRSEIISRDQIERDKRVFGAARRRAAVIVIPGEPNGSGLGRPDGRLRRGKGIQQRGA
jgi:hypothetical protein